MADENSKVRDLEAEIAELRAKQARAQAKLAEVRGKGTAHNGHIVFEVDAGGKFLDLKLNPQAGELRIEDLESSIKAAARAAVADAAKKAQEAMAELTGDPRIAKAVESIKGFTGEAAKAPAPKASVPKGPQPGDEDYEQPQSWLERA
ncbi:YbaB/EbfC family nucleoid-associated protein [Segniliparus rugosus]|uniref:YbaB/EbfC family nucleoid-associated protein n=1 Tax=Segniliparus rugosus (strain ATCC BAA-974 / DSM 45345 / CCUG 50838 / CIP 108380 / JCM 13579 / CDC 945) TaxID=679197 RepID=E5XKZ8_SEGRC|nr:YbaB/EbfC family nucleoid-associated protein [Segniliparus rugosus]EFV14980.1 hypothetical protein HMPREF9336_00167 [Segniliparus rugosus ATCC BAA-974]